jgi:hypothetical protein
MKKTLIYLNDEVHKRLRRVAFARGISMAAIIRDAVDRWLLKENNSKEGGEKR